MLLARYFDALAAIEADEMSAIAAAIAALLAEEPAAVAPPQIAFFAGPGMSIEDTAIIRRNNARSSFAGNEAAINRSRSAGT